MATTTVLTVIKTAPAAGLRRMPWLYKTLSVNTKLLAPKLVHDNVEVLRLLFSL